MKLSQKPKKFFQDIVLVPRAKKEEAKIKKKKGPLIFDLVLPQDKIKKSISNLWPEEGQTQDPRVFKKSLSLEEAAGRAIEEEASRRRSAKRIRPKTLLKNSLILFFELTLAALMVYNAFTLYFDKNWIAEKINNLALVSKTRLAYAAESMSDFDRNQSTIELNKAGLNLLQIKTELLNQGEYNYLLPKASLLNNELSRGQNMLELGLMIQESNNDLNQILDNLTASGDGNLAEKANNLKATLERLKSRVNQADLILKSDPLIKEYLGNDNYNKVANIIGQSKGELKKADELLAAFPLILGEGGDNKYLVMFLNNAEMRPGGGFPGNYGVVSFENNSFKSLAVNDIYYLQWLKKDRISQLNQDRDLRGIDPRQAIGFTSDLNLPEPIDKLSQGGDFCLFSSNWSLDFRDNAKRAIYLFNNLYQQEKVQGVIILTPDLIERILAIVGPIKMDDYGVTITAENFREVMEYKVEVDNPFKRGDKAANPKQILADFGPLLLEKLAKSDLGQKIKIAEAIVESINNKNLAFFHSDQKVESKISEFGASGEIKSSEGDSLGIFATNVNAVKNGRVIDLRASLKSEVDPLGFALNEFNLTIINNESNVRFLHGQEVGYYEILMPLGSRIREAKIEGRDFIGELDYFDEAGHTIVGFLAKIEPGEAKNIRLKYQAPILGYPNNYSLNLIKQPGAKAIEFKGEIELKNSENIVESKIIRDSIDADKIIRF